LLRGAGTKTCTFRESWSSDAGPTQTPLDDIVKKTGERTVIPRADIFEWRSAVTLAVGRHG
jgi:hypothetical protein